MKIEFGSVHWDVRKYINGGLKKDGVRPRERLLDQAFFTKGYYLIVQTLFRVRPSIRFLNPPPLLLILYMTIILAKLLLFFFVLG